MERQTKRNKNKPWWIFGTIALFLLSKSKTLLALLKFSKFGGALISMIVSIGAYAIVFPLQFAVGLVLMILVHELGHVIAAKQKGLPVSAPVFIPFMGALITMKRHPRDAETEAYIAIGGPVLGTIGALAAFWIGVQANYPLLVIIANVGFFINLINLLPIHPLDGGRIATAVTRWLWLLGLVGGLAAIIYLRSVLFFIIWVMFAWDLYKKYVKYRNRGEQLSVTARFQVPVDHLVAQGYIIPGEAHRRDLAFTTYSDLDGRQTVEIVWEGIGLHEKVTLPQQGIIRKVHVTHLEHLPKHAPEKIAVYCRIDFQKHENDVYYDVPARKRWQFGLAYGGLALFLLYMIYIVKGYLPTVAV